MKTIINIIFLLIAISTIGLAQDSKFKRKNSKLWCDCSPQLNSEKNAYEYEVVSQTSQNDSILLRKVKALFKSNNIEIINEEPKFLQGLLRKKIAIGRPLSPTLIGIQYQVNIMTKDDRYRIIIDNFNIINKENQVTVSAYDYQKNKSIGKKIRKQVLSQMVFHIEGFIDLGNIEKFGIIEEIEQSIMSTDKYSDWD